MFICLVYNSFQNPPFFQSSSRILNGSLSYQKPSPKLLLHPSRQINRFIVIRLIVVSGVIILTSSPVVSVDLIFGVFHFVIKIIFFSLTIIDVHSQLVGKCCKDSKKEDCTESRLGMSQSFRNENLSVVSTVDVLQICSKVGWLSRSWVFPVAYSVMMPVLKLCVLWVDKTSSYNASCRCPSRHIEQIFHR